MKETKSLRGRAKQTYGRVINALNEDSEPSMMHTFNALTDGAKSIVLQSEKFSNAYVRGELKEMDIEEAAKDLEARAAALVSCKLLNIDHVCAVLFLAEYIKRQRPAAPAFEELSHAATNIVLTANNSGEIYRRNIAPLVASLAKKQFKSVAVLSASGAMAAIIRAAIKEMIEAGWDESVTANDRKKAATYLAEMLIEKANE